MNRDYRYEIKFVLDNSDLSKVYSWINCETFAKNSFARRKVNSLYLDDINHSSIQDNLIGISDRKKFRLRWYGDISDDTKVSFEIKGRNGRLGWKESYEMNSLKGIFAELNLQQISKKCLKDLSINKVVIDKDIYPMLHVSYDRDYYADPEGIRMTVDTTIQFNQPMYHKVLKENLLTNYPLAVLEIKFTSDLKDQVASIVRSLDLTPKRHSKYLVGMASLGLTTYI